MKSLKIPSAEHDRLRSEILSEGGKLALFRFDRRDDCAVKLSSNFGELISRMTSELISAAIRRYFIGKNDHERAVTRFYLNAYPDVPGIFLGYQVSDNILGFELETYEVPEQIMRLVKFLEEEKEAKVEFRFGHDPDDPFKFVEFVLSKHVEMAGCGMVSQCQQKATTSFDFIWRVVGAHLEHIMQDHHPNFYCGAYVVDFVLEEEDGIVYFRMHHEGQRFFSVEKDKLRGEKS